MSTTLSQTDIKHIAKLANLTLSENELEKFRSQLSDVFNYFEILNKVDTNNIEETSQITGLTNVYKDDEIKPSLAQEEALKNARITQDGYFSVPAVIAKE